ncbi:MAG: hypothetical protein WAO28_02845 [Candidatus Microsaccharimonas sp.]
MPSFTPPKIPKKPSGPGGTPRYSKALDHVPDRSTEGGPTREEELKDKHSEASKALRSAEKKNEWKTDLKKTAKAAESIVEVVGSEGLGALNPKNIINILGLIPVAAHQLKRIIPIAIIGILVVVGGFFGLVIGGLLAPIAFFDTLADDLNDQVASLDIRNAGMLASSVGAKSAAALSSCDTSTESIKCRTRTLSKTQVNRLAKANISVTGKEIGERLDPTSYTYDTKTYTPKEFSDAVQSDDTVRQAYKRAFNMKVLGLSDKTFVGNTLGRFGGSKLGPELTGDQQENVSKLFNRSDGSSATGDTIQPSRLGDLAINSVSAFGYWDLACSVKAKLSAASTATKIANQRAASNYAMEIASLAYKAKAGDITADEGAVLTEIFNKTDQRKKITAPEKAFEKSLVGEDGKIVPDPSADIMIDNPNYGKSLLDSPLVKASLDKNINLKRTASEKQYAVGIGQKSLFAGITGEQDVIDAVNNVGGSSDNSLCDFVQSPLGQGLGILAGLPLIVSGVGTLAIKVPVFVSLYSSMLMLDHMINSSLANTVIPKDTDKSPVDAGSLIWTGYSGLFGTTAAGRGMLSGNSEQIVAYQKTSQQSKQDYIAIEQQDTSPFDPNSRYSFVGSFVLTLASMTNSSLSVSSSLKNIGSVVGGSLASIVKPASTYAASIDPARYEQCDDVKYTSIGISADIQCNVRYVMPDADLALDTYDVQEAMETNACGGSPCVQEDTTTGLPGGYFPSNAEAAQQFADDSIAGKPNSLYSSVYGVTGDSTKLSGDVNDYMRFLDFCAYRALPYGEVYGLNTNNVSEAWQTGANCRLEGAPYSYFRIYTLDVSTINITDKVYDYSDMSAGVLIGRPADTDDFGNGWNLRPGVDYSNYACDPRTTDKGTYTNPDRKFTIRVCDTKIAGIKTDISSVVSTNFMNMYEAAKKDGITFFMAEGLRRAGDKYYSPQSRHSAGIAFDLGSRENGNNSFCWVEGGDLSIAKACRSNPGPAGVAVRWLDANAKEYGFQNIAGEAWHWSTGEGKHEFNQ